MLLNQITSGVLVVVGWIVVNQLSKRRERQKEMRDFLREKVKDIDNILYMARKYHTTEVPNKTLEEEIIFKLHKLDRDLTLLHNHKFFGFKNNSKIMTELRDAITLNNFQISPDKFIQHEVNDTFMQKIYKFGLALNEHIYNYL